MKIDKVSGEFAFKALINYAVPAMKANGWKLTDYFFLSQEEVKQYAGDCEIKWPVEVYDDGTVYIPSEEELK